MDTRCWATRPRQQPHGPAPPRDKIWPAYDRPTLPPWRVEAARQLLTIGTCVDPFCVERFRATASRPLKRTGSTTRAVPVAKQAATEMALGPMLPGRPVQGFLLPQTKASRYARTRTTCGEQRHGTSPVSQRYDESPHGKTGFSLVKCWLRIFRIEVGITYVATSALSSDQIRWICIDSSSSTATSDA